jgi:malonate-semialdehyde dehydrogenase (acetylating)/methylmalonate-semialdehyde dehydrogenase
LKDAKSRIFKLISYILQLNILQGVKNMSYIVPHFINGQRVQGSNQRFSPIYHPATGECVGQVVLASPADVESAISGAKMAFPSWSSTTPSQRVQILLRYNTLLNEHRDALARLISQEHGKTLADAHGSLQRGIEVLELACAAPNFLKGSHSASVGTGIDSFSLKQPLGVCAGITPFNFPAMIALWMFPIAIVCGNTFVLKPSERDPSCALRLAELMKEAGLPDGVLNVVQGDKEAVDVILSHPDIQAVSSVGSTSVARYIYQTAAAHGKRVQAFGGAKNHAVVMPDADIAQTAETIVGAAYGSAGERCMAISVVVAVGNTIADALVDELKSRVERLSIGHSFSSDVDMGPLITAEHRQKVIHYIETGLAEGAKLVVDGRDYTHPEHKEGFYLAGCLFDHVTPTMCIYQEEIFGPVLCVVRVPDFETALSYVNEHPYGNGTAIFTQNGHVAREFAMRAQVGMVGINVPIPVPVAYYSFGGWKQSIFGASGIYGEEGFRFYTKLKTVTQKWSMSMLEKSNFNMPLGR